MCSQPQMEPHFWLCNPLAFRQPVPGLSWEPTWQSCASPHSLSGEASHRYSFPFLPETGIKSTHPWIWNMWCEFRRIARFEPNSGQCVLSHLTGPSNVFSFFHSENSGPEPQECGCDFSRDVYSAHSQRNIKVSGKAWATNQYCACTHPFPKRVRQKPLMRRFSVQVKHTSYSNISKFLVLGRRSMVEDIGRGIWQCGVRIKLNKHHSLRGKGNVGSS